MTAVVQETNVDAKSHTSYKSTQSSRSSVLERAREYTRKMEGDAANRARSLERQSDASSYHPEDPAGGTPRSQSASRAGNRISTRERAMVSVEKENSYNRPQPSTPASAATPRSKSTAVRSRGSLQSRREQQIVEGGDQPQEAVVSPELLVDALSGHEDGLLAIAEKLMEHYDSGYDVMGEAIIDAFADVQKLFQHVVEAAHMEGAAFEASRREEEMKEMKLQNEGALAPLDDEEKGSVPPSPSGPIRHDEFIDQDVKDCLTDAIRKGASLKETGKHMECYELYENACQSASALLPVDSDHRGRLQLSIARAESMNPDRACAILRYAMDDVLRSGMRAHKTQLPDPSKRADVVLSKPKGHPSLSGSNGQTGVVQSSEEQLNSMVEEMKEIISAPVYKDTPLQGVAKRFWNALADAQKQQNKNEERLEQNLGKLKGDFLLARAEWEEKLNQSQEQTEQYKRKYLGMKAGDSMLDDARNMAQRMSSSEDDYSSGLPNIPRSSRRGVESVASLGSGLAQHARSLVGSFACSGINERTGGILASELAAERREDGSRYRYGESEWRDRRRSNSATRSSYESEDYTPSHSGAGKGSSRSFREYGSAPRRVDV